MTFDPFRLSRREFVGGALSAGLVASAASRAEAAPVPIELPALPYGDADLAPHISQETIGYHYGKHHRAYVDNTNRMIAGTDLATSSLEEIVRATSGKPEQRALFNNAAQAWNHAFYWRSLSPKGGGMPAGRLLRQIQTDFGDFAAFKEALAKAAVSQFGSGWAWLVMDAGKLRIEQTSNADTPVATPGRKPLLTVDVWEHAYYVDYRNRRPDYVTAVLDRLLNWEFADKNLG
jgi:Fe-Mn family superoxide dismutase